jgi:hypothetical protein
MPAYSLKLSGAAKKLLQLVPPDGEFIGNTSLQRRSKLGKRYWEVRADLIDAGFLVKGKGRGGSVKIAGETEAASMVAKRGKLLARRESDLYEPLKGWLNEEWGKDVDPGDFFEVHVTATPTARKRAGGQWSRPRAQATCF